MITIHNRWAGKSDVRRRCCLLSGFATCLTGAVELLGVMCVRPAVEEDGQNSQGRSIENCVVVGLRDLLLAWYDYDSAVAKPFVETLLRDENQMCRRIAIFVLNRRWDFLRPLYSPVAVPEFFSGGHFHELYGLIRDHFEGFNPCEKVVTIDAIRNLNPGGGADPELLDRLQQRWLSATAGTTYEPAAGWLAQLDDKYARDLQHPDYLSYSETRWGPGPSKYSVQELISFARERTIVARLTEFKPGDMWNGPTVEALIDELERTCRRFGRRTSLFISCRSSLRRHEIISTAWSMDSSSCGGTRRKTVLPKFGTASGIICSHSSSSSCRISDSAISTILIGDGHNLRGSRTRLQTC